MMAVPVFNLAVGGVARRVDAGGALGTTLGVVVLDGVLQLGEALGDMQVEIGLDLFDVLEIILCSAEVLGELDEDGFHLNCEGGELRVGRARGLLGVLADELLHALVGREIALENAPELILLRLPLLFELVPRYDALEGLLDTVVHLGEHGPGLDLRLGDGRLGEEVVRGVRDVAELLVDSAEVVVGPEAEIVGRGSVAGYVRGDAGPG